jgi:hypothetical protein
MRGWTALGFVLAGAAIAALPATAADSKKKKDGPVLRLAHSYEAAVAEARERNCVLFVSIHAEH